MANYTKSFNFKNGVQVDDDHFIITQTGIGGYWEHLYQTSY